MADNVLERLSREAASRKLRPQISLEVTSAGDVQDKAQSDPIGVHDVVDAKPTITGYETEKLAVAEVPDTELGTLAAGTKYVRPIIGRVARKSDKVSFNGQAFQAKSAPVHYIVDAKADITGDETEKSMIRSVARKSDKVSFNGQAFQAKSAPVHYVVDAKAAITGDETEKSMIRSVARNIDKVSFNGHAVQAKSVPTSIAWRWSPNHSNAFASTIQLENWTGSNMTAADEPENAPELYLLYAIGLGSVFAVAIIMFIILSFFQMCVRCQKSAIKQTLSRHSELERPIAPVSKRVDSQSKSDATLLSEQDVIALVQGDHKRLDALLDMAAARKFSKLQEIVDKVSKVYKLSLSTKVAREIVNSLAVLAQTAQGINRKHSDVFNAKTKLKKVLKHVLNLVRVGEVIQDDAVLAPLENRYRDGSGLRGFKDTRMKKISTYFLSEAFIDHMAIAFVFAYSQVCGSLYGLYLALRFPNMLKFFGPAVLISRGQAMAIIVQTMTMVLLMTRGLMTYARRWLAPWSSVLETLVDKHVMIHKSVGVMLVFSSFLHVMGFLVRSIPTIIKEKDKSKIESAFTYDTRMKYNINSWTEALLSFPSITGWLCVLVLMLFWLLSIERVRRKSFELFQYPHLFLVLAWCAALSAHGWKQWLGVGFPLGMIGVAPMVVLYFLERMLHIWWAHSAHFKVSRAVVKQRTCFLEIDIGNSGYKYETGMYCMLKVPEISSFEWHPFTIASAGGQQKFQILFAIAGDWTTKLSKLLKGQANRYPRICVRGGYGAPAVGMKGKKHIMMVGGGVGATPFLSFLSSICVSAQNGEVGAFEGVESAVFYWVTREPDDFLWVNQYHQIISNSPLLKNSVSVRLCLSKSVKATANTDCTETEIALFWAGVQAALKISAMTEIAKELGAPTQFGRPDWQKESEEQVLVVSAKANPTRENPVELSVFACGNKSLLDALDKGCNATEKKYGTVKIRVFAEEF